MENTVRLTWAVPVSAVLLGARVEAYVESKATVSTFRLCAKYGNPIIAPVARLPTELINEILGYIGQSFFEGRLSDWENHIGCLKGYHCLDGGGEECRESHIPMIKGSLGGSDEEQRFGKVCEVQRLPCINDKGHLLRAMSDIHTRFWPCGLLRYLPQI